MMRASLHHSHLRPDVSIWRRNKAIYLATSLGPLRFRGGLPFEISGSSEESELPLNALAPPLIEELRRQGLVIDNDRALWQHPLYQTVVQDDFPSLTIVDRDLGQSISYYLERFNIPITLLSSESPAQEADIVIVPLSLREKQLQEWSAIAALHSMNVVAYLATPLRLLLAVLRPFSTPCLVCLVRRLRANYRVQDIADIPLEQLFGAVSDDKWPTSTLSAAYIAHSALMCNLPKKKEEDPTTYLFEIHYGQFEIHRHTLLRLPHCPGCSSTTSPTPEVSQIFLEGDENWTDLSISWERMQASLSPLTGIVEGIDVENEPGESSQITYAHSIGQTNTLWMSPVKAPAVGGSAKCNPLHAKVSALGEALERYACGIYSPESFIRGSFEQLKPVAIDPRSLPLGSESEYRRLNGRLAPYQPDLEIDWTPGISLTTHSPRLVPACTVYVPYKFPRREERLLRPISTGLAAGPTVSEAILAGLYEIIERDSFVIFWENSLHAPIIDLDTLPEGPARRIVEQFRAEGLSLICKLVTTDIGVPAVVLMSIQRTAHGPLVAFSSRANLDFLTGLQRALEEHIQSRMSIAKWIRHQGVPPDGKQLRQMEDFFTYYCREDRLKYLSFIYEGQIVSMPQSAETSLPTATAAVREVVKRLEPRGYEAIIVDITPVDVKECGIFVIRSLVPGLQPVTFGRDFRHLGGKRLYEAPVLMGLRTHALREDQLNPYPMPGG